MHLELPPGTGNRKHHKRQATYEAQLLLAWALATEWARGCSMLLHACVAYYRNRPPQLGALKLGRTRGAIARPYACDFDGQSPKGTQGPVRWPLGPIRAGYASSGRRQNSARRFMAFGPNLGQSRLRALFSRTKP